MATSEQLRKLESMGFKDVTSFDRVWGNVNQLIAARGGVSRKVNSSLETLLNDLLEARSQSNQLALQGKQKEAVRVMKTFTRSLEPKALDAFRVAFLKYAKDLNRAVDDAGAFAE